MSKKQIIFAALILIPVLAFSYRVKSVYTNEGSDKGSKLNIEWNRFDKGVELARKENKMLVVDFYTDWCQWCKVMDKETYKNAGVVDYTRKKVVMAKINAETTERFKFGDATYSGRELSMMFGVNGFPSTVFISSTGELITSISGFIPAQRFTCIVQYLAEDWYQKVKFEDFEKKECGL